MCCLQVAANPEIDLGGDDNPEQVENMLRLIYDHNDGYALEQKFDDSNTTKTYLDYYILGDKYDVPVLRHQAMYLFVSHIQGLVHQRAEDGAWDNEFFRDAAEGIAMVLGPSALTFGDKSIQEQTLTCCAENLGKLLWHTAFRKLLSKGQMFSTDFAGKLLLKKARLEHVEFGWDLDPCDFYDDSSSDEETTENELQSVAQAEEDEARRP